MNKYLVIIPPLLVVASSLITASLSITMTPNTYSTILSKENPPLLIEENNGQNQSADELDIDVAVDPTEPLPPMGHNKLAQKEQQISILTAFLLQV
jgi:hypothetical protein